MPRTNTGRIEMELTVQDLRLLAQLERDMDEGRREFVVFNDQRVAVTKSAMEKFMLKNGQTINEKIFIALCKHFIDEANDIMDSGSI